jgi:hypothetical protein
MSSTRTIGLLKALSRGFDRPIDSKRKRRAESTLGAQLDLFGYAHAPATSAPNRLCSTPSSRRRPRRLWPHTDMEKAPGRDALLPHPYQTQTLALECDSCLRP